MFGAFGAGALTASLTVMKIELDDDSIQIQSRQYFEDEAASAAFKEFNEGTMAMVGSMSGSADIQTLVAGTQVSQSGREVTVEMTVGRVVHYGNTGFSRVLFAGRGSTAVGVARGKSRTSEAQAPQTPHTYHGMGSF